uniref:Transmembrane protein n=1 Tax=Pithovirus LCPAC403 TaxID=2506596 RepID=A0A481ZCU4_9VIRU|nr:MAG: hypothetical protein LCPAC403_00940 [Pithovirus LCPAC403]
MTFDISLIPPINGHSKRIEEEEEEEEENSCEKYSRKDVKRIQNVYLIAAIAWLVLVFWLDIPRKDVLILIFIAIPIILAIIAYCNAPFLAENCNKHQLKTNVIAIMLVSAAIFSQWGTSDGKRNVDKTKFYKIITTAFVILMLSVIDVWVPDEDRNVVINIKVAMQGITITLLIISVYLLFKEISGAKGY